MANATDKQGGPFIYAEGQNDAGQPDDTRAVIGPQISRETFMEDAQLALMVLYRSGLWHKGMNADLVDSKHAAYLTTAVNEDDVDHPDLNDTLPAAPSGGLNVKWQAQATQNSDSQTPVSAYVPFSSISTVTAVSTDYVVITDTSDSNNPKRALVSDIATATLSGIGSGTPVAADTFVFVDADDGVAKKGSAANTLVALGAAPSATALTAAAVLADKAVVVGAAADRTTVKSDFTMTHDGTNVLSVSAGTDIAFDSKNLSGIGTISRSGNILQKQQVRAYASGTTSVSAATWTQIAFASETFDVDSVFASDTFTAGVACKLRVTAQVSTDIRFASSYLPDPDNNAISIAIYKNGSLFSEGHAVQVLIGINVFVAGYISDELTLAATDTVKIYFYSVAGCTAAGNGSGVDYVTFERVD